HGRDRVRRARRAGRMETGEARADPAPADARCVEEARGAHLAWARRDASCRGDRRVERRAHGRTGRAARAGRRRFAISDDGSSLAWRDTPAGERGATGRALARAARAALRWRAPAVAAGHALDGAVVVRAAQRLLGPGFPPRRTSSTRSSA